VLAIRLPFPQLFSPVQHIKLVPKARHRVRMFYVVGFGMTISLPRIMLRHNEAIRIDRNEKSPDGLIIAAHDKFHFFIRSCNH